MKHMNEESNTDNREPPHTDGITPGEETGAEQLDRWIRGRPKKEVGEAGLYWGLISFLIACIPSRIITSLGFIGDILNIASFVMAIAGLIFSISGMKKRSRGKAIAGMVLSVLTLAKFILLMYLNYLIWSTYQAALPLIQSLQ